jgi:predicted amidophosphoribosyltransferase
MVKEGRHRDELEYLADLLAHYVAVHLPGIRAVADSIVPVPTTPSRSAKRGYGIPETLSERVSEATAIPAYTDVVRLERETEDLRYLSRSERRAELEDAFCVAKPEMVGGYSIVIVDDIITHGTTLREIGGTLRAAGARKVFGVVLAHVESSGAI